MPKLISQWWTRFVERRETQKLVKEANKAARALDIMLGSQQWYGGIRVVDDAKPTIEVLIVDDFPGDLSTWIPPRVGVIPVLVRFGTKA